MWIFGCMLTAYTHIYPQYRLFPVHRLDTLYATKTQSDFLKHSENSLSGAY